MELPLYRGSNCIIETPEIRPSRYTKDFGPGFYCTQIKDQAQRWAKRMAIGGSPGIVNTYIYDDRNNLNKLVFK